MKTDSLEEFIKDQREEFDFREPSPELWERINKQTQTKKVISFRKYFLRAAVVLAIVSLSTVLVLQTNTFSSQRMAKNADPELLELMETEAFYSSQVDKKMKEIRKCYNVLPELKDEVETDMNELEDMYRVLKTDLEENISSRSVIEAMIENNRFRLKLCDDVLDQINC